MNRPLRVLLVEDSPEDARLILHELRRGGYDVTHAVVATDAEMRAALTRQTWDIVLCDFALPHFSGGAALKLLRELDTDAPFIFVSGAIGEETAVAAMRSGAQDYVMKDSLARLVPAVERELRDAAMRREARRADVALRESEHKYRHLFESLSDAAFLMDAQSGRIIDTNARAETLLGRPRHEIVGMSHTRLYTGATGNDGGAPTAAAQASHLASQTGADGMSALFSPGQALNEPRGSVVEAEVVREDGSVVPVSVSRSSLDLHGRPLVLALFRDITELKKAEKQILTLTEHSPDVIMRFDRDVRYLYVNAAVESANGIPAAELIGTRFGEWLEQRQPGVATREIQALRELTLQVFQTGMPVEIEVTLPLPAGVRVFNVRFIPESDELGNVATVLSIARDITQRKKAEEALRESEQRFRQVTENIDEVFWLTDAAKTTMIYVSPAYASIWGRSCESLYAAPDSWLEAVHAVDYDRVRAALPLQATGGYDLEYRIVCPDGAIRWIHDRAFPVTDAEGHCYRIAGLAENVTMRRQLEEQFRQAQKMEAIGQLAGGIAHDFNNLLTVIQMQTSMLLEDLRNPAALEAGVQELMGAARRAAALTRQLLTFSRRHLKEARDVDLAEVVGTMLKLVRRILGEDINLETRFAPGLPWVHADSGMLEQVLMNLLVNARDAMPRGGRILLTLESMVIDADYVATHPPARPGAHVCLAISDTGCGIPPEIRSRIFEPFFTTKEAGKGSGLGLATVFGIVQQHQGWIEVESEVGQGTTFRVFLPALQKTSGPDANATQQLTIRGGNESILLVEDDTNVRSLSSAALRRHGYNVIEVRCAAEVLDRWPAFDGKFDLLVTDIVMPGGISGQKLAKELHKRRPNLKVVFTTGYSSQIARRQLKLEPGWNYLPKPYSFTDLTTIVRRRLDET